MGALHASSLNVRRIAGVPNAHVTRRRERPRGTDSAKTSRTDTAKTTASIGMSSESAVIQQAIAGDVDAQERLFAGRAGRLFRIAFAVLRNKEDAEDAVQEGRFRAFSNIHCFEGRSSFSSWLTRI